MEKELLAHIARYPRLTARDLLKFCYQSEYGGGHLAPDPARTLRYLEAELAQIDIPDAKAVPVLREDGAVWAGGLLALEPIGGGLMRLHLRAMTALGLDTEAVNALFLRACEPRGSIEGLNARLDLLLQMQADGRISVPDLPEAVAAYRAEGCPATHHSEAFRAAYAPAYRLVPREEALRRIDLSK